MSPAVQEAAKAAALAALEADSAAGFISLTAPIAATRPPGAKTTKAMVRREPGENDPLVQELIKCQQAEAILKDETLFPESFDEMLEREKHLHLPS